MSDFKQQYKNPRPGFGHADHSRVLRASKHVESRREVRTRAFDKNRKLQDVSTSASPLEDTSIKDARMKKLIKWKEERKRKKKMEDAKKKPAFKVGVVHHSVYSPVTRSAAPTVTNTTTKSATASKQTTQSNNNFPKGITKVTQKRLLYKATSKQIVTRKIAAASTPTKYPSMNMKKTSSNKKQKSFAPDNCEFRPPNGLLKMPLFGLVQVEQTPQEKGDFFIQDKSTECKTVDRNKQENTTSQKLNENISNTNGTTTNFNVSASSKLSNEKKLLQGLNKSICDDANNVTPQSNETTTKSSSLEEEIQNSIQDFFQDKSLSGNTDRQTPAQKNTPINTSFGNRSCTEDLITFSPYLTLSRGKKNARKEQQQRLGIYPRLSSDEIPTKDTVMKNLNISAEEEERTAQYFKFLLNKETERLKELCRKWLDIKLEKDIPDDAKYEIHQAVGQTNLLINKKFERFRSLVEDCENGKGEKLVTCRDLQGFWDMAYMEVRNCDSRFEKLEQRQKSGWQEECIVAKPAVKKRIPIKKQIEPSKQIKSSSSLRSLIMAARKKKMQGETSNLMQDTNIKDVSIKYFTPSKNTRKSVNFDDNTDTQCNTRKSKSFELTRKSTPVRRESFKSLVQEVQLSSNKRVKSPFVTMKVSQMGKTPEIQLDDTISYINSDQTPGKSILKKSEELVPKETHTKSAHKVNFDDQIVLNEVPLDEEEQTKLNLSLALKRIDSLDLEELSPEECFDAGKKLNFETDDSDHFDDINEISTEIQRLDKEKPNKLSIQDTFDSNAHLLNTTFDKESSPSNARNITPKKKLKYQNQHKNMENLNISATPLETERPSENVFINIISATPSDTTLNTIEMENHDLGIKILRNRTITTVNTSKNDRTSKSYCTPRKSVSKKENKDPVKLNRKSSLKLSEKDENKYKTSDRDNITEIRKTILTENIDRKRRSSRKSVAFSAETCLACTESKPVLPMTPHSKRNRSKTPSRKSRSKHECNEDLISWDTPKHIPNRVTRSHTKN